MANNISKLSKFDLPSGYRYTGLCEERIQPLFTPENMTAIWNKLNELIDIVKKIKIPEWP